MSEYLDRKQVIELYEKHHSHLATYVWEFGQELRQLPIVEERPHGEWIPCSEKLPKRNELVVASLKTGVQLCEYLDDGTNDSWFSLVDNCYVWNKMIKAWMPLPEPYKEGGVNE